MLGLGDTFTLFFIQNFKTIGKNGEEGFLHSLISKCLWLYPQEEREKAFPVDRGWKHHVQVWCFCFASKRAYIGILYARQGSQLLRPGKGPKVSEL